MRLLPLACFLATCLQAFADPTEKKIFPTVVAPKPDATFVGAPVGVVESFQGIPFAKPPEGNLRYHVTQALDPDKSLGKRQAVTRGPTCPQNLFSTDWAQGLPQVALGALQNHPLWRDAGIIQEDCLYLNIYRPKGIDENEKLPVLFWMHGGGFTMGFTFDQEGVNFVTSSMSLDKPVIFVAATYRVGGFGFLGGKEVLDAGVGNLGLLDQRQAMRWVADNIEAFGGDPDKVTIWGESAGAISVFDHLILYDGDNTYNDKPLFRAGIMNSGSLVPADPVDCDKAQEIYDRITEKTGCSDAEDSLQCLREADYQDLLKATSFEPTFTGYESIALSWMPRPDGKVMTKSPEYLVQEGKFAKVPIIIGDEEDEGTIWSLMQPNITKREHVAEYLGTYFFRHASEQNMDDYVATYQTITEDGSPFRTGLLNNWYPQYKRLAAILGDLAFNLSRRYFLEIRHKADSTLKAWSYQSSYFYGLPILGSFHGGDIFHIVFSIPYDYATRTMHSYYTSFIHHLDPNEDNKAPNWPQWHESNKLLNLYATHVKFIPDDFRKDSYEWIKNHVPELTM